MWHWLEVHVVHHWHWLAILVVESSLVLDLLVLSVLLQLLWHWWKSHTLWKVWKWIDQSSFLAIVVEERATVSELALTGLTEVLAWLSLVVGVDCTQSCRSESFWKWVMWLSELVWTMSKLTVLLEWAISTFEEVLAHLGLILLSQSVEFGLVSIEVVIVRLLSELSHHLARWVVEVSWLAIWSNTLSLVSVLASRSTVAGVVGIW